LADLQPLREDVTLDIEMYSHCLAKLQTIVPYQYAQWLIEDPDTHDYRVISSVIPDGAEGYTTAHRTGVIGQVFRLEESILVPDVRDHPLYDPFDTDINWELCFPVFVGGKMTAVVNLEGAGALAVGAEAWDRVCQIVEETTQGRPPSPPPPADNPSLIDTHRIVVRTDQVDRERLAIIEMARAIARGGETTLLVGHYPDLLQGRRPTIAEASQKGLGVSYCYFGVEQRLDLLATGPNTRQVLLQHQEWWTNCNGRYAFILQPLESRNSELGSTT
jgi:hypothetical protein